MLAILWAGIEWLAMGSCLGQPRANVSESPVIAQGIQPPQHLAHRALTDTLPKSAAGQRHIAWHSKTKRCRLFDTEQR